MTARERRRAIIELLCVRRHEKRDNLAREFGVSKRTIEYDILQLSLEYPIYTTTGRYGGVSVVEGFCLSEEKLSCRQQALLVLGRGLLHGTSQQRHHRPNAKV